MKRFLNIYLEFNGVERREANQATLKLVIHMKFSFTSGTPPAPLEVPEPRARLR